MRRRRAREECIARVASESYVAHADREYIPLCPGSSSKREANARVLLDERERENYSSRILERELEICMRSRGIDTVSLPRMQRTRDWILDFN